jgi:multiple sugar transport system substrate-binding protein
MHVRRKSFLLLVVIALVLTACGPNADSGDESEAPDPATSAAPSAAASAGGSAPAASGGGAGEMDASGDLFAYGFAYETGDTVAKERIDYTLEQYPDLNVTYSESGFDSQGFLAALQGSDRPDIVNLPRNVIGSYIARGALAPLDDCIGQAGIDTANFYEPAIAQVTVDGSVYALPEFYNTRVWLVNDSLFEEAGLNADEFDFGDWDAIEQASADIAQVDGGIERLGVDPKVPEFLEMWVRANGGQMLSDDGRESLLDTPEVAEALEFTVNLVNSQGGGTDFLEFRNDPSAYGDFFGPENQFVMNTVAAFPMEQWYLNVMAENTPDAPVSAHPFVTREGEPITLQDGNAWAIVAESDNMEAGCAFIASMVSTEAWVAAAEARQEERTAEGLPSTGVYTGNREADEQIFGEIVDLAEFPQFQEMVDAVLEGQETAFGFPPSPAGQEFQDAVADAVNRALTGEDVATVLQEADQEAQAAIDSAGQ